MSDFEFGAVARLSWLWALVPFAALLILASHRAARRRSTLLSPLFVERLATARTRGGEVLRGVLLVLGCGILIVALAKPRFGFRFEEVKRRGADLVIAIDVSRSMLSTDVQPTRLERAKMYVRDLLAATRGDRVALVAFAGKAVPLCPLTVDQGFFAQALDELSTDSAPRGGTAIGDAIRTCIELLEKDPDRDAGIVLITDGEDHESFPLEAAAIARERGVKVFTVGIGDPGEGARVPGKDGPTLSFGGKEVVSKMDEGLLTKIAVETAGAYVPARTGIYNLGQVYTDHLASLRAAELSTEKRRRFVEQFQWFAAFGAGLLVLARLCDPERRRSTALAGLLAAMLLVPRSASATEAVPAELEVQAINGAVAALAAGRAEDALALLDGVAKADGAVGSEVREKQPESPRRALARGAALAKLGRADEAKVAYHVAAGGSDAETTLRARYNLGMLESESAKATLGEQPEEAEGETRTKALSALDAARDHFRAALDLDPNRAEARHNLELLRLYVKNLKDAWKKRDEAKKEQEKKDEPVLDQLERLSKEHEAILAEVVVAESSDERAAFGSRERAIAEELPVVVEKLKAQFDAPPQAAPGAPPAQPAPKSDEQKQAEAQLLAAFEAIRAQAEQLAADLEDPAAGVESLSEGLAMVDDGLAGSFLMIAPYERILRRGLAWQENHVAVAKGEANLAPNHRSRQQRRIAPLAELLVEHAKRELPQLEQSQPPELPEGLDEKQREEAEKQLEKQEAAIEGRKESMKRAIEKAPAVAPLAHEAASAFAKADPAAALPKAEEIERILKEIAEPLQNEQQDPNQKNDQDQNEKNDQDSKDKKDQPKDKDDSQQQQPQDPQDPKDEKQDPKDQQPQDLTQQKIEQLLKQAQDREKEFEAKKKKLLKGLGVPVPVEKDW